MSGVRTKQCSSYTEWIRRLVKRRTGVTRKTVSLTICGLGVKRMIGSPVILRERWLHIPRREFCKGCPKGRTYHFAVVRFAFEAADGRLYSAKRVQCFNANSGLLQSLTGFYSLQPL